MTNSQTATSAQPKQSKPSKRSRRSGPVREEDLIELAGRLTDRDHLVVHYLAEYQTLTTGQIAQVMGNSLRRVQERLRILAGLGVVSRVRVRVDTGSLPYHWILGRAGVVIRAIDTGESQAGLEVARRRALNAVLGPQRAHLVGVNGWFASLVADDAGQLSEWWSERRCAERWADVITPDGYGEWCEDGRVVGWWLEYDRGTEPLNRLVDKAGAYGDLQHVSGPGADYIWLLITCPSRQREDNIRAAIDDTVAETGIACATASHHQPGSPAAAVWQPVGGEERLRLIDLADTALPDTGLPNTALPDSVMPSTLPGPGADLPGIDRPGPDIGWAELR